MLGWYWENSPNPNHPHNLITQIISHPTCWLYYNYMYSCIYHDYLYPHHIPILIPFKKMLHSLATPHRTLLMTSKSASKRRKVPLLPREAREARWLRYGSGWINYGLMMFMVDIYGLW